ncbi:DUF4136 domain-containing protein [Riemerella anatipestifer]|uniref:DUF4136 domain-containing protein n=2 Tax=Riemerella anatipestifer TaxID=34085 RepID=UPI0030C28AD9
MKKYVFLILAAATTLSITSCSPFNIRTDYAETAQFNQYKTYMFRTDDLKINDLDKDRVLNEIAKQFNAKGLSTNQTPDLIVNVKASHKKVEDIQSTNPYGMWGWGGPWGWGWGMNRTWVSNYNTGTLVIDIVDAKTNKLVWQGIGSGINVDAPKSKQKQIPQVVEGILKNYPPQKK